MNTKSKSLVAIGALMLLGLYFLPMWWIKLEAPQYPGDLALGIKIHINKVVGAKENDLDNINGLNHYVGMNRIEPDSIPELKIMPYIVAGLIAFGLLAALIGKKGMVVAWIALVGIAGVVGMYDFWKWEYEYGHNLSPHAIIKIPDMTYQPPLIGTEVLLNFTASSYPDIAFYMILIGIGLAVYALKGTSPRKQLQDEIQSIKNATIANNGTISDVHSTSVAGT